MPDRKAVENAPVGSDACRHCDEPVRLVLGADFVVWAHTGTGKTRCEVQRGNRTVRAEPSGGRRR